MSNSMSFMLWELAKHQDVQARLRREIASVRAANGGAPLAAEDLENMPYLQAVVKVYKDCRLTHLEAYRLLHRNISVSMPLYTTSFAGLERTMSCRSSNLSERNLEL